MDHSRLSLYYLVRLPVSKASPVTIDLPVPILGHNFLNLNDSRLLVGSVSNFIYEKKNKKSFLFESHLMKSKTLVSSSIQWDFCSFLSRERNADGIHQPWHNAIFVNEMNSDNFCQWNQFQWIVNESMISMYLRVTTEAGALFLLGWEGIILIFSPATSRIKAPTMLINMSNKNYF